ncbi:hypothetical protein ACIQVO_24220 [Streptomyces sp. NPDC101062]
MAVIGCGAEPLPISVFMTFTDRPSFAGSGIGGIAETEEATLGRSHR